MGNTVSISAHRRFMKTCIALADGNDAAAIFLHEIARTILAGDAQTVKFGERTQPAVRRAHSKLAEDFNWTVAKLRRVVAHLRRLGLIETFNGDRGGQETRIALTPHATAALSPLARGAA